MPTPFQRLAIVRAKIEAQDAARGRPLTDTERLSNLFAAMRRCDQCDNAIDLEWHYCASCGYNLIDE